MLSAIRRLSDLKIKGLGPAAANFLHPTIIPPFNTAIVKSYNRLNQHAREARELGA